MLLRVSIGSLVAVAFCVNAWAGDTAAGKDYFAQVCTQCHTADENDGGGEMGPTLFGLYGRPAATGDSAFPYSKALRESKLVWNAQTLERFLENPTTMVPGTTMVMLVLLKSDRDNLIAYFQSLAGSQSPQ